jgi:hypothetical protein
MTETDMEIDQVESSDIGEVAHAPHLPTAADFIAVDRLIRLILDPRIARKTLRDLRESVTASNAAREALQRERQSFDEHARQTAAELEGLTKTAASREVAAHLAEEGLRERQADLAARGAALDRENSILKRRIAVLAGFSHEMDVPLRAKMSWRDVAAELMQAAELVVDEPEMEAVTERVEHTPIGSTLTRTRYQPRARSMRRVNQAEVS